METTFPAPDKFIGSSEKLGFGNQKDEPCIWETWV